jgi:alcohol dehydrogenase (cytochrome c)
MMRQSKSAGGASFYTAIGGAALAAALLVAGVSGAQEGVVPAPAFAPADLARPSGAHWATNGGSLTNQRYSPLDQINRENVSQLRAVRRLSLGGSGLGPRNSGQGQPLYYEGVLYSVTGDNDVFAHDVETGELLWEYRANLDERNVHVCCGWVSRGLGMGDGMIFLGRLDAKLTALDQKTGKVVWEIQAEDPQQGYAITSAPLYYDGMVITGFAGGEFGIRGRVKAYDAKTGELIWTFYTIPGPGEIGHETWPQDNDAWMYGGAPVWQTPAVDPDLGLIYFSTGNPGPDLNGAIRAGDNLFSTSIVALDVKTGEYRWHFQQVRHDIWDYDSPQPVILFDAMYNGEMRRGLAEIGKSGYLYILDRTNGEPLVGVIDTPAPQEPLQATAATQPIPIGDEIMPHSIDIAPEGWTLVNEGRTFTPFGEELVIWKPSAGSNWMPSAYYPAANTMFICANDGIGGGGFEEIEIGPEGVPATYMGGRFASATAVRRGIYAAVDLKTNRLVWRQQWADRCQSGSTATAGGLVFLGRNDGRLTALDVATGEKLWEFQTDAGVHASPSVFEHNGEQYVAAFAGGTIYAGSKKGDGIWLFALSGTMESLPPGSADVGAPPAPLGTAEEEEVAVVTPPPGHEPDLAHGREIYLTICQSCHGAEGDGGHEGGGAPLTPALTMETILTTATHGRNQMPAFDQILTPEDLHDVAAYILEEVVRE